MVMVMVMVMNLYSAFSNIFKYALQARDLCVRSDISIHLIPKWPPFRYSFVFIEIRP